MKAKLSALLLALSLTTLQLLAAPKGLNWLGPWNNASHYLANDAVFFSGSSWVMPVMVIATGSPSGSRTPTTDTSTNWWFGGQSMAGLAAALLQSGGRFPGMVVVVGGCVVVMEVVVVEVVG